MTLAILTEPAILYCVAEVEYNGRARSRLEIGRYLVIRKDDNSVSIHNNQFTKPCNYISKCGCISRQDNKIEFTGKGESITITIFVVLHEFSPKLWSSSKPVVSRTEKDLVARLLDNWVDLIGIPCTLYTEYPTTHGPVDVVGVDENDVYHVVEVKRKQATVSHCYQVRRYLESLETINSRGYLVSPTISDKAQAVLNSFGCRWIQLNFE